MKFISSISGYGAGGAAPVALACFLDEKTETLVIVRPVDPEAPIDREGGFSLVTSGLLDDYDMLFTEDMLSEAVAVYFSMLGSDAVAIEDDCMRYAPEQFVRPDGLDEKGVKYRFSDRMGNGAVAILAACLYAKRNLAYQAVNSFADALNKATAETYNAPSDFLGIRSI